MRIALLGLIASLVPMLIPAVREEVQRVLSSWMERRRSRVTAKPIDKDR